MEWSNSFPSEPGLYLLKRGRQFFVMRVLEGGLAMQGKPQKQFRCVEVVEVTK